jgi:hypothetical protein
MTSPSSSRIYTCEFYNHDNKVKRLYEIAFEILPREQGKSLEKDKHPILVHTINGTPIANGYAVAFTLKWDYMGTVLFSILLNRISYVAGSGDAQYWFPSGNRPARLVDGSIRVHTTDTNDMEIVFLTPLDTLPFMDATGTFVYQYTMISKMNMLTPSGTVLPELNTPMTLYQTGEKFRILQDNTTMMQYKIAMYSGLEERGIQVFDKRSGRENPLGSCRENEGVTTFHEMPFNDILQ